MERIQEKQILNDLNKKMVLITGPRQVGKTWLAKKIMSYFNNSIYLNYDNFKHREIIISQTWNKNTNLLVLDEIHKMPEWKNYLKGLFDTKINDLKILVTGSSRLDNFRKSGDSLAGRYFIHRLLPFSIKELKHNNFDIDFNLLLKTGGFPEPMLSDEKNIKRWRLQYIESLIRYEILDLDKINHIKNIEIIFQLLRTKTGSPVSYQSIAEDVKVSPATVKRYINILETLFIVFSVTPYSKNIVRSLHKAPKYYFYDTGLVNGDEGVKLENLVAVHLLKHCLAKTDIEGIKTELKYLRTKEQKEVDFCIIEENSLKKLIEVKYSKSNLSANLKYFSNKYNIPAMQIVKNLEIEKTVDNIDILKLENYLLDLYI
ncbi:MAG: ATP-binding protein [Candidatus Muiribacteriota bacterium]